MTKIARLRLAILIVTAFLVFVAIAYLPILAIMLVVVAVGWAIFEIVDQLYFLNSGCKGDDAGPK